MITNAKAVENALIKHKCEQDHLFFTRYFFKPRMGFKFTINWHHVYIAWVIDEVIAGRISNVVINVPPGAGKTELMTNLIPRGLALNSRSRFLYLSYSQTLVEDVSSTARNIVKSEEFQELWQVNIAKDTDAKGRWKTVIDGFSAGQMYATGMGGQLTGFRAGTLDEGFTGCIVLDDPIKPEDAFSVVERNKANRRILNTVNSRKARSDIPIILIMQRLHTEDPSAFILNGGLPGEYTHINIPALIDADYIATLPKEVQAYIPNDVPKDERGRQSYWNAKESLESLLQLEKGGKDKDGAEVSRYTFSSQYMQNPLAMGGDLIKSEWFGRYTELPPLKWRAIWADTAQKVKEHNDFSVFLEGGLGQDDNFYVIRITRGKWEAPDLLVKARQIIEFAKPTDNVNTYGKLRHMAVEDKASGTALIQTLGRENTIPIRAVQRNTDKLTRLMDVVAYIEQGRVFVPDNAPWVSPFLQECEAMRADMTHDHDDQVDTLIDGIHDTLIDTPIIFTNDMVSQIKNYRRR